MSKEIWNLKPVKTYGFLLVGKDVFISLWNLISEMSVSSKQIRAKKIYAYRHLISALSDL